MRLVILTRAKLSTHSQCRKLPETKIVLNKNFLNLTSARKYLSKHADLTSFGQK